MIYCHGCGKEASVYVDVAITVTSREDVAERRKRSGLWLCPECELKLRKLLTRDVEQKERVAAALTSTPRVIYRTVRV